MFAKTFRQLDSHSSAQIFKRNKKVDAMFKQVVEVIMAKKEKYYNCKKIKINMQILVISHSQHVCRISAATRHKN